MNTRHSQPPSKASIAPYKYWAFVSYSSEDKKWAGWLRRKLENHSIPESYRDKTSFDGVKLGKYIRPIFRDRDDLSGNPVLEDSLKEALATSRFLVVLCSPHSAHADWVNKEIEEFKKLREDNSSRILALVMEGEPNAISNDKYDDLLECFPPAIRNPFKDPLAGDLRKSGDGPERGYLKILAGMTGLDFDQLYQRHMRAQRKKLVYLLSISVAVMMGLVGLATYAIQQKERAVKNEQLAIDRGEEAKRQRDMALLVRDEAQKLNSFLVFDLRGKLKQIGRLDMLQSSAEKTLNYLDSLPAEMQSTKQALRTRGVALDYLGELELTQGNPEVALEILHSGDTVWTKLLEKYPEDPHIATGYGIHYDHLCVVYQTMGKHTKALQLLDKAISMLEVHPKNSAIYRSNALASILITRANVRDKLGMHVEVTVEDFINSVLIAEKNLARFPDSSAYQFQAIRSFSSLSKFCSTSNNKEMAISYASRAVEIGKKSAEHNIDNLVAWRRYGEAAQALVYAYTHANEWEKAIESANLQVFISRKVSGYDLNNSNAKSRLAIALDDLGLILTQLKKDEKAYLTFNEAFQHWATLMQKHPMRLDWQRSMSITCKRQGDLMFGNKLWKEALNDYQRCLKVREFISKKSPTSVSAKLDIASATISCGEVLWKMKHYVKARLAFEDAIAITAHYKNSEQANRIRSNASKALKKLEEDLKSK